MAHFFSSLAMATGVASVLMSAGILAWQTFQWHQFAVWPDVPVYYAFDFFELHYPVARWVGVQKLMAAFLQLPLSVVIFGLGMLLAWLFAVIGSAAEREEEMRSKARR